MGEHRVGFVVIGRNEGERLKRCLWSIPQGYRVVYVDSGSSDDSVAFAKSTGSTVVELDTSCGFTAARARNAGWRQLLKDEPKIDLVQFVDGDCEVAAGWLAAATAAIDVEPHVAVVFGRRRERFPERSVYNKMCDDEWNAPLGIVDACGGDALFRASALHAAGGYSDDLIAGEEPDLCLRLSRDGWHVRRIDAEMTLHDANIHSFRSWWRRTQRAGFAFAEHVWRHGSQAFPQWRRALARIVFWGLALPTLALLTTALLMLFAPQFSGLAVAAFLSLYIIQFLRISWRKYRSGHGVRFSLLYAGLLVLGKFSEAVGALQCWSANKFKRRKALIEYK